MTGRCSMTKRASATAESGRTRLRSFLLILGIVLLAANLRPALTGVAPLIGQIRADTGMSNGEAGLLTTLPLLAFGLLSPIAPRVARRFGMERVLLASLLVLAAGILLRWAGAVAALFLGTVVLGAAIAVANVLLPSLVKREFPGHAGLMTSVYSTSLGISAAVAAGVSVPLTQLAGIGWRGALAVWAIPVLLASVAWLPQLGLSDHPADPAVPSSPGVRDLWRSPLAWQVTLFMGPMIAERRPSQRGVVVVAVSMSGLGVLGLLVAGSTASTLWVVLLGLGQGASFSLALTFFALRAPDPGHAAALSGMAQS